MVSSSGCYLGFSLIVTEKSTAEFIPYRNWCNSRVTLQEQYNKQNNDKHSLIVQIKKILNNVIEFFQEEVSK